MANEAHAMWLLCGLAACGADARDGETSREAHAPSPAPSGEERPIVIDDARVVGEPVCLPVAACNMFIDCALAQPERNRAGATSYRVLSYDHHPQQVGALWQREEVCWPEQSGGAAKGCADALLYRDVPCTPVPNEQMAVGYTCKLVDQKCVAERPTPPPGASSSDGNLTHREIEDVVKGLRATTRTKCWDPLAKTSGPSTAKVTVRFTIEPSGTTSKVGASGPAEHPTLTACVGKAVEAARFPAHASAMAVSVPFAFSR